LREGEIERGRDEIERGRERETRRTLMGVEKIIHAEIFVKLIWSNKSGDKKSKRTKKRR